MSGTMSESNRATLKALMDPVDIAKCEWKKVTAPKKWDPSKEGEELIGYYGGQSETRGKHGLFTMVLVAVPGEGVKFVTGVIAVQLIDTSGMFIGCPIKYVWNGYKETNQGHQMKQYDLFIGMAHNDKGDWP